MWHNEECLAPLFLKHYENADRITVILDDCTDDSIRYLDGCDVQEIQTGGLDDINKGKLLSSLATESNADVRIVVDADEFVYPTEDIEVRPGFVYSVGFWEVFRHSSDVDVNFDRCPLQQRKHGNSIRGQSFGQNHFIKPIVFGKGVDVWLAPGNHYLMSEDPIIDGCFDGSHWAMADPALAVARRCEKKVRMSKRNYDNGLTSHDWNITPQEIIQDCANRLDSPKVIVTDCERF